MSKSKRKIKSHLTKYRRSSGDIPAVMGNYANQLYVPNRANYIFVRLQDGTVIDVYNVRVTPKLGLEIWIGYLEKEPHLLQVTSARNGQARYGDTGNPYLTVQPHHLTHEWMANGGGNDVVFSQLRQFMPLRPTPLGGMTLGIYRSVGRLNNTWVYFSGSSVDLSSYVPVTGSLFALVYETPFGTPAVLTGVRRDANTLSLSDIPTPPDGTLPIAAVRLYGGQTGIVEARTATDLVDLRYPYVPGSSSGGGGGSSTSISLLTNEDHSAECNNSEDTFATSYSFSTGSTCVYLNGLRQQLSVDYTEGLSKFIMTTAPLTGDTLIVDYLSIATTIPDPTPPPYVPPVPSYTHTYYVDYTNGNDANNGTSTGTPWKTISKVNSTTFAPGDGVLFRRDQSWTGRLELSNGGITGSPVTVGAYGAGARPIIYGGSAWTPCYVNRPYVRYESLDFSGGTTSNGAAMSVYTHDVEIYDCIARDSDQYSGIRGYNESALTIYNITVSYCQVYNNYKTGIAFTSKDGEASIAMRNIIIEYCTVHDNSKSVSGLWAEHGIYTRHGAIVRYNTCYNNIYGCGIKMNCQELYNAGYYPTVYGNTVYDNMIGIGVYNDRSVVYNNLAYNNNFNYGFDPNSKNCTFIFNTAGNTKNVYGGTQATIRGGTDMTGTIIKNNLFIQDRAVSPNWHWLAADGGTFAQIASTADIDYNIIYTNGNASTNIFTQAGTLSNWTTWKARSGSPDANSTFLANLPDVVARYTDLHPTDGGNLKGLGVAIGGYSTDKDGTNRTSPPTPGCYDDAS